MNTTELKHTAGLVFVSFHLSLSKKRCPYTERITQYSKQCNFMALNMSSDFKKQSVLESIQRGCLCLAHWKIRLIYKIILENM